MSFLLKRRWFPVGIIPSMPHTHIHSSTNHRRSLATDSVVKQNTFLSSFCCPYSSNLLRCGCWSSFTRAAKSPATPLLATQNTWQTMRPFTRSTVCLKSPGDREYMANNEGFHTVNCLLEVSWRQGYCQLFYLLRSETDRLTEDKRTRRLHVTSDSVHGDWKRIRMNCHKEFVNWIVLSLNCSQNKQ